MRTPQHDGFFLGDGDAAATMKTLFDPNCEKEALGWECVGDQASIRANQFGNGSDKQSDFRIVVAWQDIEEITIGMAAENHEGALSVQRALNAAAAIKDLFENSN